MSNPPNIQRSNLTVNVINEQQIQPTVRLAITQQLDAVVTDLETAYARIRTRPQPRPVQISINIAYSISELIAPPNNTTAHAQPIPPDQTQLVGNGNLRADLLIGRFPTPGPAPDPDEPQELFDVGARSLRSMPTVALGELPEDGRSCPVCTEGFSDGGGGEGEDDDDMPVGLKCGHVVGRKCIEQWILSRHNSCPICRAAIFEPGQLR